MTARSLFFGLETTSKIKQVHPYKHLFSKYKENNHAHGPTKHQDVKMEGVPRKGFLLKPCIPLVEDKDKEVAAKYECVELMLKAKAALGQEAVTTGQKVGAFKKSFKIFENGTVPEWIKTLGNIQQVWSCNNVTGPHERVGIVFSILKDEALDHFEASLRSNMSPGRTYLI